jgi:hypothetical protein
LQSFDRIMTITALKRVVVIKVVSIHISISSSPYPSNVGRHNHPLLGPNILAGDPPRKFGLEEPKADNIMCHWGGVLQNLLKQALDHELQSIFIK